MKERVNTRPRDKENKCKRERDFNKDIQTDMKDAILWFDTWKTENCPCYSLISAKSVMFYIVCCFTDRVLMNNSPVHSQPHEPLSEFFILLTSTYQCDLLLLWCIKIDALCQISNHSDIEKVRKTQREPIESARHRSVKWAVAGCDQAHDTQRSFSCSSWGAARRGIDCSAADYFLFPLDAVLQLTDGDLIHSI